MRPLRNPIRFQLDCLQSLSGGCAPNWWRREVAADIRWLNAVLQACGWLVELDEIDLRVSRDPLFGHGLEFLTSPEPNNPFVSETSRTLGHQPAIGLEKSESKARMMPSTIAPDSFDVSHKDPGLSGSKTVSKKPSSSYLPELITRLQPRAGSWLLRQHVATEEASVVGAQRPNVRRTIEASSDRIRASANLPSETTSAKLLARAARSAETAFFAHGRLRCGFDRLPSDDQAQDSTCRFTGHWSQPIDGVRASEALLALLANPSAAVTSNSQSVQKKETAAAAPTAPSNGRGQRPPSVEPPGKSFLAHAPPETEWLAQRTTKRRPQEAGVESTKDRLVDTTLLPPRPSRVHAVEPEGEWPAEAGIAAPTLTPSLVALRPRAAPQDLDLPVAATINQREAKAEAATSEADDLAFLAAKVEKLLNQEARRHGIDV